MQETKSNGTDRVSVGHRTKKYFKKYRKPVIDLPNLVQGQIESFDWLITDGVKEVFQEFASTKDYSEKKFELQFTDFSFEDPKLSESEAREEKLTYERPLKVTAKLINKTLGSEKEQEIFLADFPVMTKHGTFIINGIERVIVPQLARSYGVLFTDQIVKGRQLFGAKIIPARGAWIEFETDADDIVYIRIDRNRKFFATTFLRTLGLSTDEAILKLFKDDEKTTEAIKKTLEKDPNLRSIMIKQAATNSYPHKTV